MAGAVAGCNAALTIMALDAAQHINESRYPAQFGDHAYTVTPSKPCTIFMPDPDDEVDNCGCCWPTSIDGNPPLLSADEEVDDCCWPSSRGENKPLRSEQKSYSAVNKQPTRPDPNVSEPVTQTRAQAFSSWLCCDTKADRAKRPPLILPFPPKPDNLKPIKPTNWQAETERDIRAYQEELAAEKLAKSGQGSKKTSLVNPNPET